MKGLVSYIFLVIVFGACLIFIFHTTSHAYSSREDSTEFRENLLPAQQGDAKAQVFIAYLYETGQGVNRDYAKAAEWYGRAAQKGNTVAQTQLGNMYRLGKGVPQDYVLAYMWLELASEQGSKHASELIDAIKKKMSAKKIAEAKRMALQWKTPK